MDLSMAFEIKSWINVKQTGEKGILENVKTFIRSHCSVVDEVDSIIIIEGRMASNDYYENTWDTIKFLNSIGKNVIYIDEKYKQHNISFENIPISNKIWHPSVYNYFYKNLKHKMGVAIPIIAIYNFTNKDLNE